MPEGHLILDDSKHHQVQAVLAQLSTLRDEMVRCVAQHPQAGIHPNFRASATNLQHYLALRRRDLRPLQEQLSQLGLSSLGRAEAHALASVDRVRERLLSTTEHSNASVFPEPELSLEGGRRLLEEHTRQLLGPAPGERNVRIMVTMPSEAATNPGLVQGLLRAGMDCMRINCAHDDEAAWEQMIVNLRTAQRQMPRPCQIFMDLAGPKLRTGPLTPGPSVLKLKPQRNEWGQVTSPAHLFLAHSPAHPAEPRVLVPREFTDSLKEQSEIRLVDARGSNRTLIVTGCSEEGCWVELYKTTYLVPNTVLQTDTGQETSPRGLPTLSNALVLATGDTLRLTRDTSPGSNATYGPSGEVQQPASIGCTLPHVFEDVRAGQPIWFDDGKIGGVIQEVRPKDVLVEITHTRGSQAKLRPDKGINFPESNLRVPALTAKDHTDLRFAAQHADAVGLSFANTARDVEQLQALMAELPGHNPGIVLKIETRQGFKNLPKMLLTAMRAPTCGVMIARGDLAVECGFERLAEVQEEVLWLSEAAHVPVIWATQVLESLAKVGIPSRAEITDAAMGHRAECVMLNKGPHIQRAVESLDDILKRMQDLQAKKRSMLRELNVAHTGDLGPQSPYDGP